MQFRRPTMGALGHFWKWLLRGRPGPLPLRVVQEFLTCMMHCPLYVADLRLRVDGEVTVSDASMTGGGMCRSTGLTSVGESAARAPSRRSSHAAAGSFVLVSAFEGIGGARRAWDLLNLPVALHLSYEVHKPAVRVVNARWPDALQLGDIEAASREQLLPFRRKLREAGHGLLAGGWHCVGMSMLNTGAEGLQGRSCRLVRALLELWALVRSVLDTCE